MVLCRLCIIGQLPSKSTSRYINILHQCLSVVRIIVFCVLSSMSVYCVQNSLFVSYELCWPSVYWVQPFKLVYCAMSVPNVYIGTLYCTPIFLYYVFCKSCCWTVNCTPGFCTVFYTNCTVLHVCALFTVIQVCVMSTAIYVSVLCSVSLVCLLSNVLHIVELVHLYTVLYICVL